jgi:hypothetical protein
MLAAQAWRAYKNPQALWVQVLKAVYFSYDDFLHATGKRGSSWRWASLLQDTNFLIQVVQWKIGNGEEIFFWKDNWVEDNFRLQALGIISNPTRS